MAHQPEESATARWSLPSAKTKAGRDERDRVFREIAPTILAAVELNWLPSGYAGPGMRLEYLRLLNRLDPGAWARDADVPVNTLHNWRSERTLADAFGPTGASSRLHLARLLSTLEQTADLAWVLTGTGRTKATPTLESRAKIALDVWNRLHAAGDHATFEEISKRVGIASFAHFKEGATGSQRADAVATLAVACAPWCSACWLGKGLAPREATLHVLMLAMEERRAHTRWRKQAMQPITITLPRGQVLDLVRVLDNDHLLPAASRQALRETLLASAEVPQVTLGGATHAPLSVDEFLAMTPTLRTSVVPVLQQANRSSTPQPMDDVGSSPAVRRDKTKK